MAKFSGPLVCQSYKKDPLCYVAVQSVATVELKVHIRAVHCISTSHVEATHTGSCSKAKHFSRLK